MKRHRFSSAFSCIICTFCVVTTFSSAPSDPIVPPGVIFEALALNHDLPTPVHPEYRSPADLVPSPDGAIIYICEQTAKRIAMFTIESGVISGYIQLPNEVTGCAVSPDGKTLYATCSSDYWPNGMVCLVNTARGEVTGRIAVGNGVRAPVITPDGRTLFVCNRYDNDISRIDLTAGRQTARIPAVREPYCAALAPDGGTLVVGNLLAGDRATDTLLVASQITIVDVATVKVRTNIRLRRGSTSVLGVAVSPDGKFAFATHLIGEFNQIGTTVERGWLHTNNVGIIDIPGGSLIGEVNLDYELSGAGNPWGVRCSDDGGFLVVAHAGSNELSILRLPELIDSLRARPATQDGETKDFTLAQQTGMRIPVVTKGPRAVAIVGQRIFTAGYFDDSAATLEELSFAGSSASTVRVYRVGEPQVLTGGRIGERNFHDATLCFQKWQSCSSCHPFARDDGLHWILGGGAVVAPVNTKSLVYAWWNPPWGWSGHHGHAQQAIVAMVELRLFRAPTRDLTAPIDTFLFMMKSVPSPALAKGRLSTRSAVGKIVFNDTAKSNCSKCHPAPKFSDGLNWNAGVPDPFDPSMYWKTPYLAEAWRTGPYGHLGSYLTLREISVLPKQNAITTKSTESEFGDLLEYVKSL